MLNLFQGDFRQVGIFLHMGIALRHPRHWHCDDLFIASCLIFRTPIGLTAMTAPGTIGQSLRKSPQVAAPSQAGTPA
jgi:hypothetical protein